jgi:phosphatidylglycerophosphatase A
MNIQKSDLPKKVFSDWKYFLGFGFGSGLLPLVPGTWGTLATVPLIWILSFYSPIIYISLTLLILGLGAWISDRLSQELGVHDYGGVNIDEVAGFLITMYPFSYSLKNLMLGFVLFRFFDMVKPFPINWIDKNIHGGIGMMIDDVAAAFLSILTMYFILYWIY